MSSNIVQQNWNLSTDPKRLAVVKVWDYAMRGATQYLQSNNFVNVMGCPEMVSQTGACEAVNSLFKLDFFGKRSYLSQSDQLYIEQLTPAFKRVYTVMHSFRAESEVDDRHLCEFVLLELEHIGYLDELIHHVTSVIRAMLNAIATNCETELALFDRHPKEIQDIQFTRMKYEKAIEWLNQNGYPAFRFGDDLKAEHERALASQLGPLALTHYEKGLKFFSMQEDPEDPRVVLSFDAILPFAGESAGAAQRETNYDKLAHRLRTGSMYKQLIELGHTDEDFHWYLDIHKNNDVPTHSGTGIGVNRVIQFALGQSDIRYCAPFLINRDNLL